MHAHLVARIFENISVQAFKDHPERGFQGGCRFTRREDDILRHSRYWKASDTYTPSVAPEPLIEGEYCYAGAVTGHFGHYMAEMSHRILPTQLQTTPARRLYIAPNGARSITYQQLPRTAREVADYFLIRPQSIRIVSCDSVVQSLYVCEQGSDLGGGPKDGYVDDLGSYADERLRQIHRNDTAIPKVYVSRSGVLTGGTFLGERYLESILEQDGFFIFKPENYSLTRQMDVYSKADVVVFADGSACHGVELLGRNSVRRCYLLSRRAESVVAAFVNIFTQRTETFEVLNEFHSLGTFIHDEATGMPWEHLSVCLYHPDALAAFFKTHQISKLTGFNKTEYIASAARDLVRYFSYNVKHHRSMVNYRAAWRVIGKYLSYGSKL